MIPVEVIFNPNWWNQNFAIRFDQNFYLDCQTRIDCDVIMRQALFDRFGLGLDSPQPRPIIGSMNIAGGFVLPAIFGVPIRFSDNEAPWPVDQTLNDEEIMALSVPDLENTWPLDLLIRDAAVLKEKFGYVIGDFDLDGLFNSALHLRGQRLFTDLLEAPELVNHLFSVLSQAYVQLVLLMRRLTGSCAIATNRSIVHVDPTIFLHSNCSVSMLSPAIYKQTLMKYELDLANQLQPYGIHHCAGNMHKYSPLYKSIPAVFFDVGWGSNVSKCRGDLPNAFINLRLSPVRMLQCNREEIYQDTLDLLKAAGDPHKAGVCCINMDAGTPDDNVFAMFAAAKEFYRLTVTED
jgi:hypothetical protein